MQSEKNGENRPLNPEGLYRQKVTGAEVYLEGTPGVGTPIIDAFIQAGYERVDESKVVSPATPEVKEVKK